MRPPHYFFWANLVLRTPSDAWAVYELEGQSYPGLSDSRKVEVGERLEALAYTLESDFQILRVARSFDAPAYERRALATLDPRHGHREAFARHLAEHRARFEERGALRPEIYLAVRLGAAGGAGPLGGLLEGVAALWRALAERAGYEEARGIGRQRLAALRAAEEGAYERVLGYLECSRVGPRRLAGLIRRAYTRGLGEPDADENFAPQALSFLDPGGEERFEPYGYDLLRLHESRVTVGRRSLLVDSERGRAHQAQLVLGAMPEEALVPGPAAELMFAPLELPFGVDATLAIEFLANREARRQVAKRKIDADQIAREESAGEHGPSVESAERPHLARELEAVLGGGERPPLLRSALLLSLAGRDSEELEERVARLRESYGRVELHRPGGEQHRLFLAALPATTFPLPEYKEHLLPDQVGAMVPHAISQVGSRIGPYIGHTLSGSRSPVQFDLAEACQQSRPPTCLLAGSLGSGKTIALELLAWQAFLQGSLIVDIDPKGDHRLDRLSGMGERIETIELSGEERYRGLLDPMRVGGPETREDLTYNFLVSILPTPVKPEWQTQLRLAVSEAATTGARSTGEVLERLATSGGEDAAAAARAVEVHASAGLAKLGLGSASSELPAVGDAQLVSLRIRNLTLPLAGTARAELLEEERTSLAVLRLLAAYALRLCATDTERHAVLAMDEAWALTADTQGRALLERISRLGRSQNITPILATQMLGDAAELEPLVGALFALARGAPPHGGGSPATGRTAQKHQHRGGTKGAGEEAPPTQLTSPGQTSASGLAAELGASGQVDPLSGLGIRNPVCDSPAQIRSRQTRLACEADGTPESEYPASNYGFDIFISTGVTHPIGDITYGFATVLNGIWLGLLFVLKLVLSLLGLAFGLNPFGDGQTMSQISAAVGRLYTRITDPWLSTLVVCGGIWFAHKGLIKREVAAGVGGTLAAIAMLVAGLWVVQQPRESVGQLAGLSDGVALGTISAPQSGSISRPVGSYAEAMSNTWSRLVEVPFAGLDFSDVGWALGPPPAEAVKKADERFCQDFGALALLAVLANLGSDQAKQACANFAAKRYGRPKRVIDLYLRSSPGSAAREALWNYFNGDERYKAKVAAQGGDGVLTRLSMLALFAIGLLGAILLLAWLAIRLFTQAATAFVLLLAAPFALFLPLLGDAGRRGFKTWGLTLLGAVLAKVIYAAFLSIVLLGIAILGQVDGPAGSATGFLLSAAFTWSVFLKRAELVGWISVGDHEHLAGIGLGGLAALKIGSRVAGVPGGAVRGVARRANHLRRSRAALGAVATRETAKGSLQDSARALAEQRYREARETVGASEDEPPAAKRGEKRAAGAKRAPQAAKAGAEDPATPAPSPERQRRAKELLAQVERNQGRLGKRWSERDLRRFEAEDRELLQSSRDPADHAHRAGYERSQFEALKGPERERAEQEIEKARKRDVKRLAVASEVPGRIVGRRRLGAERMRQGFEDLGGLGSSSRPQHLRRLRRERRAAAMPSRRNLSRGG